MLYPSFRATIRGEYYGIVNTLEEVDEDTEGAIPHAYFVNNLSYAELEVILA